ncbi:glycosyltransferase [Lichenihabitans sp. Uapishka_5]|uniref:glycosyltransferase n=1 Tax=Lichenihabitans sp. Uapishka_5 TaxID=3037302 RepID=UPI0029E806D3|nr:glycosyltransferase [Lichenihabitans sp. Uapishka_5]MDX7953150.1 glycosyltransferase [Lichenihabitans sp. Uapishka_5]
MASSSPVLELQQSLGARFGGGWRADPPAEAPGRGHRPRVAVLLPCRNEEASIAAVVADFRRALPDAVIVVYDNASTDRTAAVAAAAGAAVFREVRPGRGHVVRRMFSDVDADIYLMADGDGTYDAASASQLVALVAENGFDMAVGARAGIAQDAHRPGHAVGNWIFNRLYRRLFDNGFGNIFSGYRAFSRRFVKSFPALSSGFEIETEMSVHARQLRLAVTELSLPYGKRRDGSASKLRTVRDGVRIFAILLYLLKETRPLLFFGMAALVTALVAVVFALPLFDTFITSGTIPRLPTAILCAGLGITAALLAVCGTMLDSVARGRAEQKRMLFLAVQQNRQG